MQKYIGTKIIEAEPCKAWKDTKLHKAGEDGYKVRYPDGYESWSPKDVFEDAYRPTNGMNFGLALEAAKKGSKITRRGWNGKGMYVFLADAVEFHTDADLSEYWGNVDGVCVLPVLVLRTAKGDLQPGWLASQNDMLADDWEVVE